MPSLNFFKVDFRFVAYHYFEMIRQKAWGVRNTNIPERKKQ